MEEQYPLLEKFYLRSLEVCQVENLTRLVNLGPHQALGRQASGKYGRTLGVSGRSLERQELATVAPSLDWSHPGFNQSRATRPLD